MKRRLSDRTLGRWLQTGKPARVTRRAESDPEIASRLEAMTALDEGQVAAIHRYVTPEPDFEQRVVIGVQHRIDTYGTTSLLVDMLGLGFHVGRAVLSSEVADEGDADPPT